MIAPAGVQRRQVMLACSRPSRTEHAGRGDPSPGGSGGHRTSSRNEAAARISRHPLYAVVQDRLHSGGYVAAAADQIYVAKGSIVGSIGVRMDNFGLVGS